MQLGKFSSAASHLNVSLLCAAIVTVIISEQNQLNRHYRSNGAEIISQLAMSLQSKSLKTDSGAGPCKTRRSLLPHPSLTSF